MGMFSTALPPGPFRLHVGGEEPREGWRILNIQSGPQVDYIGDCSNLGQFPDACCDEIYASHVLEHLSYKRALGDALRGFHRILKPQGRSVLLARLMGTRPTCL